MSDPIGADISRFKALFDDAGIGYEVFEDREFTDSRLVKNGNYTIRLTALESAKVRGYDGFVADFTFSPRGEFIEAGVWE